VPLASRFFALPSLRRLPSVLEITGAALQSTDLVILEAAADHVSACHVRAAAVVLAHPTPSILFAFKTRYAAGSAHTAHCTVLNHDQCIRHKPALH
jgi:hypothetical protein